MDIEPQQNVIELKTCLYNMYHFYNAYVCYLKSTEKEKDVIKGNFSSKAFLN